MVAVIVAACGGDARSAPGRTYTVRGLIRQLPAAGRPGSELLIHHEPIPDFVDAKGRTVGMDAMSMPFPVSDPTLLDGLAVGDRVELDLHVAWDGSPPVAIERIERLPEGTRLDFESTSD